ncbi:hypothetical protein IWX90DRAFT_415776 [Phyllosticta citrichinensis]|uniref:Uncharacterized protein n=1 Tax=Phyllosticta citrichinensis TaxID=1130410 RepID=A0ABR1XQH5_9PEZI
MLLALPSQVLSQCASAATLLSFTALLFLIADAIWKKRRVERSSFPSTSGTNVGKSPSFYGARDAAPIDVTQTTPYKSASFDPTTEKPEQWWLDDYISDRVYATTMALRSLPSPDWLRIDSNYAARMAHKRNVLEGSSSGTLGYEALCCEEGGVEACEELLGLLVEYLPRRFPRVWTLERQDGERRMKNLVTGEISLVDRPYGGRSALEVIGRITEEDLAVLLPGGEEKSADGLEQEYVLKAAVSAFPAGFDIKEKMNQPLTSIHDPVPTYKERLRKAMNKFFSNFGPDKLMMRINWSINDKEEFFLIDGGHLYEGDDGIVDESVDINQVHLRIERQVLRRLPKTGAMCMLTKTYLHRLVDIAEHPGLAARLGGLLHKLPEKLAFYKRRPVWGKVVLQYLDEMAKQHPES